MKIVKVEHCKSSSGRQVLDCAVGHGYWKAGHGSLPDVDCDFQANRRPEVKAYLEKRYNKNGMQRVFSAGTFTTIKIKTAIKDICRVHRISAGTANYITAIVDDDKMSWTDFMRLAAKNKRVRDFVEAHPDVFEEILPLLSQTRSAGIHASAVIITPEYVRGKKVDCFDLLPVRKMDGLLVSEISGYDIDAIGILKNDVLAIAELDRLSDTFHLIADQYGQSYTILDIISNHVGESDLRPVMEMIGNGYTQGVFQMSGQGITRFIKEMQPSCIDDLIALVALFRPGPLDTGAAKNYVDIKNGNAEATYLWGTHDTLQNTYGQIVYQEQIAELARKIGGLSLGDGVNLVKAISKKKIEKVNKFKKKFFDGAEKNGCPKEAIEEIWNSAEKFASYAFNRAHATAYGLTAYVGAWLKYNYPMAFYSVILRDIDNDKLPTVMKEIKHFGKIKLVQADINVSGENFTPSYDDNKIYWSLCKINYVGAKAVKYIVKERQLFGKFISLEEFIKRIFHQDGDKDDKSERNPVNIRCVKHLILCGAFDNCEHINNICERYDLLKRAYEQLNNDFNALEIPDDMKDKEYYWVQQQIKLCGMGIVDYRTIWNSVSAARDSSSCKFINFEVLDNKTLMDRKGYLCATIVDAVDRSYTSSYDHSRKHFGKVKLTQNMETSELTIWGKAWEDYKNDIIHHEGDIIAANVEIAWSDYSQHNDLKISGNAFVQIIKTK